MLLGQANELKKNVRDRRVIRCRGPMEVEWELLESRSSSSSLESRAEGIAVPLCKASRNRSIGVFKCKRQVMRLWRTVNPTRMRIDVADETCLTCDSRR